jgi:hypothetical protein
MAGGGGIVALSCGDVSTEKRVGAMGCLPHGRVDECSSEPAGPKVVGRYSQFKGVGGFAVQSVSTPILSLSPTLYAHRKSAGGFTRRVVGVEPALSDCNRAGGSVPSAMDSWREGVSDSGLRLADSPGTPSSGGGIEPNPRYRCVIAAFRFQGILSIGGEPSRCTTDSVGIATKAHRARAIGLTVRRRTFRANHDLQRYRVRKLCGGRRGWRRNG